MVGRAATILNGDVEGGRCRRPNLYFSGSPLVAGDGCSLQRNVEVHPAILSLNQHAHVCTSSMYTCISGLLYQL